MFRESLREADKAGCGCVQKRYGLSSRTCANVNHRKEAITRAQYHLSLVLRSKKGSQETVNDQLREAVILEEQVQNYKQTLVEDLTVEQLQEDNIRILDFVSSLWSGRPNLTGSHPFPLDPQITSMEELDALPTNKPIAQETHGPKALAEALGSALLLAT